MCPQCRADHDKGYAANRVYWIRRLIYALNIRAGDVLCREGILEIVTMTRAEFARQYPMAGEN